MAPIRVHVERRTVSSRGATSPMVLVYSFLALDMIGTLLLILPISNTGSGFTPFVEALFTSTSAVAVTGLVVVDTAEAWSSFGQVVIMVLFFIGGLGFMTGAAFLLVVIGQRIGLQGRLILQEGLGGGQLGAMATIVRNIVIMSVAIQLFGMVLLFLWWFIFGSVWEGVGWGEALWQSAFHAVSAFNNAGFEILPDELVGGPSLEGFNSDYVVLGIIGVLIVMGGLGYTVLSDIWSERSFHRLRLDTKLVLIGSAGLIVAGTAVFLIDEWGNEETIGERSGGTEIVDALFHSVAARTAGFSTLDYEGTGEATRTSTEVLMFVGGATASTAGGIKMNTFMVVLLASLAIVQGKRRVNAFGRQIPIFNIQRAMGVVFAAIAVLIGLVTALGALEPDLSFSAVLFEAVSAFGTVGLSTGVTSELGDPARLLITFAMFAGRFGPLALALLMAGRAPRQPYQFAEESVRIG